MSIVLFTDVSGVEIPIKPRGAYNIAHALRTEGYEVRVFSELKWILENHPDEFMMRLDGILNEDTELIGFSTVFLSMVHRRSDGKAVWNNGNSTWYEDGVKPKENTEYFEIDSKFTDFVAYCREAAPNARIVLGGEGESTNILWESGLFDSRIRGLAEHSILKYLKSEKYSPIWSYDLLGLGANFNTNSLVYHRTDAMIHKETLPLELSRGCRFKCKFCSFPLLGRNPKDLSYIKSAPAIAVELKDNYERFGTTNYMILCDTFNESNEKLEIVLKAKEIAKVDFRFSCYARIELMHKFPEQIGMMNELGVRACHFGLESLNYESAKAVGKGLKLDKIVKTLGAFADANPKCLRHSSFIAGLPHETKETLDGWGHLLLAGDIPLTSHYIKALNITMGKPEFVFHSEFDLNAEKHGYDRSGAQWKNEHWSYLEASQAAEHWNDEWYKSGRMSIFPWKAMSLLSLGYTWDEILNVRKGTKNFWKFRKDSIRQSHQFREKYFSRLWV